MKVIIKTHKIEEHVKIGSSGEQLLMLIAQGVPLKEIGSIMGIGHQAVFRIRSKLRIIFKVKDDVSLIFSAIKNNIIDIEII